MLAPRRTTPTSAEVAKRAGVSRATVSYVLNNVRNSGISKNTRQKVLDAASELGYHAHAAARSLAGGVTGTVALVFPSSHHLLVDAYLPRLLSTVNDCCHAYGYKVLLEAADDRANSPGAFMNLVNSQRIDGMIVVNLRASERPYVQELANRGFPIVEPGNGLDSYFSRHAIESQTLCGTLATRHLIALGHRDIAHLTFAPEEFEAVQQRRRGYEMTLEDAGIVPDFALLAYANISALSGYIATKRLLDRKTKFTALFAGNDTVAFGAMRALTEAEYKIPRDIAIVGCDDIPLAAFASPPLTTLYHDPAIQGREAVDMLHAQINGQPYERSNLAYDTRLIIRESCGLKAATRFASE